MKVMKSRGAMVLLGMIIVIVCNPASQSATQLIRTQIAESAFVRGAFAVLSPSAAIYPRMMARR